ncbi:hypothetical protein B5X24_HaOG207397 [Helicoverpa armigera]|uniref:Uncharacterized protein n=1 Tax=Helicoverpa armigera TaxID=29058 RepID=A0A2W1BK13_HELAM|nr:hypothetical protein B5X24_HaOG207397 [Helicoverpa armigera]
MGGRRPRRPWARDKLYIFMVRRIAARLVMSGTVTFLAFRSRSVFNSCFKTEATVSRRANERAALPCAGAADGHCPAAPPRHLLPRSPLRARRVLAACSMLAEILTKTYNIYLGNDSHLFVGS